MEDCSYGCGQKGIIKFKNGKVCCREHYTRCRTYRQFNSKRHKKQWKDKDFQKKCSWSEKRKSIVSKKIKDIWSDPTSIYNDKDYMKRKTEKITEANKNPKLRKARSERLKAEYRNPNSIYRSNERKQKASESMKKVWSNEENRKKLSISCKKRWNNELRNIQSKVMKERYKDPNYLRNRKKGLEQKPNKQERILMTILPDEYSFVGDGTLWIDGKNPDFINEEKNKIIELFGKYWHGKELSGKEPKENEIERIEHFKKNNYKALIIWDYELHENLENVKERIINFNER